MKSMQVSGYEVLVDDVHENLLVSGFAWSVSTKDNLHYLRRNTKSNGSGKSKEFLHRLILDCPEGMMIDHINGNGLDNRTQNLRICTHSENMRNRRRHKNNKSGYKGVYQDCRRKRNQWRAQIKFEGKKISIGSYKTPEEAHKAYMVLAKKLHKEFARPA
jgi:hypothetical protein